MLNHEDHNEGGGAGVGVRYRVSRLLQGRFRHPAGPTERRSCWPTFLTCGHLGRVPQPASVNIADCRTIADGPASIIRLHLGYISRIDDSDDRLLLPNQSALGNRDPFSAPAALAKGLTSLSPRVVVRTLAIVTAWLLGLLLLWSLRRVVTWVVLAGFFSVVLSPLVDVLQKRMRNRRGIAVGVVVIGWVAVVAAVAAAFVIPVATRAPAIARELPNTVSDAGRGQGRLGEVVRQLHLAEWVSKHEVEINEQISTVWSRSFRLATPVMSGIAASATIVVLCVFFLLYGPGLCAAVDDLVPVRHQARVRTLAANAADAMSHYMFGNFIVSLVAGTTSFVTLSVLGVPSAIVIASWVAFADLLPLIGATLGAVPAIAFAFLHSTTAGVVTTAFFIVYQQFENSVLQVAVMRRTVKVSPLTVILSVLIGVELLGLLGAFLAIPAAGVIQLVAREISEARRARKLLLP